MEVQPEQKSQPVSVSGQLESPLARQALEQPAPTWMLPEQQGERESRAQLAAAY